MWMCLVAQSCPTLCDPMDCSPPGSSVHEDSPSKNPGASCHALLQGIVPTQGLNPGLPHCRQILHHLSHQRSPKVSWHHSYLPRHTNTVSESVSPSVMCNSLQPMDCSPPVSSVHGIIQARILEWVVVPSSRGSSWPGDRTHVSCTGFFTTDPPGNTNVISIPIFLPLSPLISVLLTVEKLIKRVLLKGREIEIKSRKVGLFIVSENRKAED